MCPIPVLLVVHTFPQDQIRRKQKIGPGHQHFVCVEAGCHAEDHPLHSQSIHRGDAREQYRGGSFFTGAGTVIKKSMKKLTRNSWNKAKYGILAPQETNCSV
jgi:hypothetical protein